MASLSHYSKADEQTKYVHLGQICSCKMFEMFDNNTIIGKNLRLHYVALRASYGLCKMIILEG